MKALTKSVMTAVTFAWVSLSVSSAAYAVETITPGSACQPFYGSDAKDIFAFPHGVFTGNTSVWVTCPIVRTDSAATAVDPVFVELFNNGGKIGCSLASYEWDGSIIGSNDYMSTEVTGPTFLTLKLPASASSKYSQLSVRCLLPPYSGIHSIFARR